MKLGLGFKKYFRNTSWLLAERVLRMGLGLVVGIYIARHLGPQGFGVLSYVLSFVGLFMSLASLGITDVVIRELVNHPDRRNAILGTAFCLKLAGVLLMWLGIGIAIPFAENSAETNGFIILVALSIAFQAFQVVEFHYQALARVSAIVLAQFTQVLVSSIVKLALIYNNADIQWFIWAYVFDAAMLAFLLTLRYSRQTKQFTRLRFDSEIAKLLLARSWPLLFQAAMIDIYMKIDQVMIKHMLSSTEVGIYAAAVRISEAWYFVPMAIVASLFPAIIEAKSAGEPHFRNTMQQLYDFLVWLSIAVAVVISFLAPFMMVYIFGKDYAASAGVLQIHIWAGVFAAVGVAIGKEYVVQGLMLVSMINTIVGAIVNIGLNYWLLPAYGVEGAAFATLIAYFISAIAMLACFQKSRPILYGVLNTINIFRFKAIFSTADTK